MVEMKETPGEKHWVICALYKNGRLQLENRIEQGTTMFGFKIVPGGSVALDETFEEAAMRETREEYGVEITKFKEIGIVENIGPNSGTHYFRHVFLITDWNGELHNPENRNEHLDATLTEARIFCEHPITQRILDLLDEELIGKNR